ncbi:MAG: phosphohydrolase [Proteobacteria bacterium]|nr:MAG: phosphohydrolase [Pseudomonadota bacterium]
MSGTWIQTFGGRRLEPLSPRAEDLAVEDIAHALSLLCRFNGHCRAFYSVAEHSVRVARILPPELALWGLLHDAGEAYLGDIPRPAKRQLPAYVAAEEALMAVVARRFGLAWPMPPAVAEADTRLLATEARDLMGPGVEAWGLTVAPLEATIEPWPARVAEAKYLSTFRALTDRGAGSAAP